MFADLFRNHRVRKARKRLSSYARLLASSDTFTVFDELKVDSPSFHTAFGSLIHPTHSQKLLKFIHPYVHSSDRSVHDQSRINYVGSEMASFPKHRAHSLMDISDDPESFELKTIPTLLLSVVILNLIDHLDNDNIVLLDHVLINPDLSTIKKRFTTELSETSGISECILSDYINMTHKSTINPINMVGVEIGCGFRMPLLTSLDTDPLFAICKTWRWSDLRVGEWLRHLSTCTSNDPDRIGKDRQRRRLICINPFHWSRVIPHRQTSSPQPTDYGLSSPCDIQTDQNVDYRAQTKTDIVVTDRKLSDTGEFDSEATCCLSEASLIPTTLKNTGWWPWSSGLVKSISRPTPHTKLMSTIDDGASNQPMLEFTTSTYLGDNHSSSTATSESLLSTESSSSCEVKAKKPRASCKQASGRRSTPAAPGPNSTTPWAALSYWENRRRLGRSWVNVASNSFRIAFDKRRCEESPLSASSSRKRHSLHRRRSASTNDSPLYLSRLASKSTINDGWLKTDQSDHPASSSSWRQCQRLGSTGINLNFDPVNDLVWIDNEIEQGSQPMPIFVSSPTFVNTGTDDPLVDWPVIRVPSGCSIVAFNHHQYTSQLAACSSNVELPPVIHISLGKGWGPSYRRPDLTHCPARLEVWISV